MSDVLQFIRDAAPELKGVPDGELAAFLSDMAPQLAHVDPEFSAEVSRVKPSESMGAMLSIPHTPDFAGTMNEMFVRMGQLPPNAFNIVQEWAEVGDELSKELPTTPEAIGAVPPSQPMPHLSLGEAKEEFEKSIAPLPDLPDYFFGTDVKAGALAAGYDLVKGMSDFATSLAGMTFMSDPALAKVGAVYMGANMLANSPEAYRQSRAIMDDPNATPAERTRAKLGYFAQVGLGVLSSYGGARPMAKGIASRLDKAIQAERPTTIPLPSESPAEFVARQTEKGAAPSGVAPLTAEVMKEVVPEATAPTVSAPKLEEMPAGPGAATAGKLGEPRRRKFIVRFKESEEIQPETRVATGNEFYDPRSNQETNAAVNTLIEREGIDGFMARILKDDPLLAGEEKVVGAFNITKRLDKQAKELTDAGRVEEANSLRDRIIDLVETTGERGTLMGRAIQAFRTWDALTPEGVLMDYTRRVKRAQVKALAPHADSVEAAVNELTSEKVASKPRNERVAHIERFPAETTEMRRLLRKNSQKLADLTKQPELFEEFIGKELSAALKIPEVNKEFGRGIMAKVEAAQKLPAGFARDFEMSKIMGEIGREIAPKGLPNAMDIGIAWWYASILSGPATQVVNFVSAALNTASSLGLTAMTHAAHPIAVPWQILKGYVEGIGRGFREARAIITKGDYTRREGGIFTPMTLEQIGPNEPLLARVLSYGKFVGRSMTAADMFNFKGGEAAMTRVALWREGYRSGLRGKALREHVDEVMGTAAEYQVAMRQAEAEGLKGNDIKRRADELVENRVPGKAREEARQYGLEATFNERPYGLVGMVAEGISQLSSKFLPLRFIVPFARIVANVLNEQLNYTPWGYARAYLGSGRFGRLFIPEKYVKIFAGDQLRHQALKASAGTAAMAVMYAWSRWIDDQDKPKVTIHGYGPREPGPRKQWLESGARPYSLEYKGKFFVYLNSPLAMPFAIIGNVRDAERYSKLTLRETGSRLALSTAFAFATIKEQSFLTGLTDFLSAMNVEHGEPNIQAAVNLVGRTATSPVIPAFVKWLDRIWDPRLMQADDILERMARDIPIARSYMKPMINRLGDPVVMEGPARFGMQRFVGREKDDAIWKLIVKNRAWIPYPQKYIVVNGEAIQLTSDEYYDIVKESGKRIKEYLHNNLADLQKRPAGEVRELVEQAAETQTGVVRNPLRMKKIAEQQARRAKEKE